MKNRRKRLRFQELIRPIAGQIQGYAAHVSWDRNGAADIFQTALLNAYSKFDEFEEGTNFKAWIFKFVTYASLNANRKHEYIDRNEVRPDPEVLDCYSAQMQIEDEFTYEEILSRPNECLEKLDDRIGEALRCLPSKRRSILMLRIIADLSYKEIAEIIGVPIGTVMGEIHRGRKELRKELAGLAREMGVIKP